MDKLHDNDFVYNSFGPNANRCHNNLKELFSCPKTPIKPLPKTNIYKLEGADYSYVDGIYIYTHLDA